MVKTLKVSSLALKRVDLQRVSIFLIFTSMFWLPSFAVNIYGGYITYKNTSKNIYEVQINVIRNCSEMAFTTSNNGYFRINFVKAGGAVLDSFKYYNLNRINIKDITYPAKGKKSGCGTGNVDTSGQGYEIHTYGITINLDSAIYSTAMAKSGLQYIEFGWTGSASGLSFGIPSIYFYNRLYVYSGKILYNNSPEPVGLLNGNFCCNTRVCRSFAENDTLDFDSIKLSNSINPQIDWNKSYPYVGTYTSKNFMKPYCVPITNVVCGSNILANPIRGIYFDSLAGQLLFVPTKCDEQALANFTYIEYRFFDNSWHVCGMHNISQVFTVKDDCGYNNTPKISFSPTSKAIIGAITKITSQIKLTDATFTPNQTVPDTVSMYLLNPVSNSSFVIKDTTAREKTANLSWIPNKRFIGYTYHFGIFGNDNYVGSIRNGIGSASYSVTTVSPRCNYYIKGFHDINKNGNYDGNDSFLSDFEIVTLDSGETVVRNPPFNQVNKSYLIKMSANYMQWKMRDNSPYVTSYKFDTLRNLEQDTYCMRLVPLIPKAKITGQLYIDLNSNCKLDSNIELLGTSRFISFGKYGTFTDPNGLFTVFVDTIPVNYSTADTTKLKSCGVYAVTQNIKLTMDSALHLKEIPLPPNFDIGTQMSIGRVTRGFEFQLKAFIKNYSSSKISSLYSGTLPKVTLQYNKKLKFVQSAISPVYLDTNNGIIKFSINDLGKNKSDTFPVTFNAIASNFSRGDKLDFILSIDSGFIDSNLLNNAGKYAATVLGPFDPNLKSVQNDSLLAIEDVQHYRIDFQNYGDDTARNVLVVDTLAAALDISTLEMVSSSFPCKLLVENNVLKAYFKNINLTDTITSMENSKGYVDFSIKPHSKSGIQKIENFADIYFDFEEAVRTNTTLVQFRKPLQISSIQRDTVCDKDSIKLEIINHSTYVYGAWMDVEWCDQLGRFSNSGKPKISFPVSSKIPTMQLSVPLPDSIITSPNYRIRLHFHEGANSTICDTSNPIVLEKVAPDFELNKLKYCERDTVFLKTGSNPVYSFELGNSQFNLYTNMPKNYLAKASLMDTLLKAKIVGNYGCIIKVNKAIIVNRLPILEVTCPDSVCLNSNAKVSVKANGLVDWAWNNIIKFPILKESTLQMPIYNAKNFIYFNTKDSNDCVSEKELVIHAKALPKLHFQMKDTICLNEPIVLDNLLEENIYRYKYGADSNSDFQHLSKVNLSRKGLNDEFWLAYKGANGCVLDTFIEVSKPEDRREEANALLLDTLRFCKNEIKEIEQHFKQVKLSSTNFNKTFFEFEPIVFNFNAFHDFKSIVNLLATSQRNCVYLVNPKYIIADSLPQKPALQLLGDSIKCIHSDKIKWYEWSADHWVNTGLASSVIRAKPWSFYKVESYTTDGCKVFSDSLQTTSLNTNSLHEFSRVYFQNPVYENLLIRFTHPALNLAVMDMHGKMLYSGKPESEFYSTLDLKNYRSGFYFINILFGDRHQQQFKLVKVDSESR